MRRKRGGGGEGEEVERRRRRRMRRKREEEEGAKDSWPASLPKNIYISQESCSFLYILGPRNY
jgi:hypothetical protein